MDLYGPAQKIKHLIQLRVIEEYVLPLLNSNPSLVFE